MLMSDFIGLILLFLSSLVSATLFPGGSEIVLAALHLDGGHGFGLLLGIASAGNILGSVINYFLGRYLISFQGKKWFPFKDVVIQRSSRMFNKYGKFSLLFAWLPVIGDPLTLVAGVLRVNFWVFLGLVSFGKVLRYLVLMLAVGW
jgi:membrane protein YqaA with SNARE-associated domain